MPANQLINLTGNGGWVQRETSVSRRHFRRVISVVSQQAVTCLSSGTTGYRTSHVLARSLRNNFVTKRWWGGSTPAHVYCDPTEKTGSEPTV